MWEKIRLLNSTQKALLALVLILPAPLIGVACSFYLPAWNNLDVGGAIWLLLKIWLIVFPVLWLIFVDQKKLSWSPCSLQGVIAGFIAVVPVSIAIFAVYWIAKGTLVNPESKQIIEDLGITSPAKFLIFASAMSLGNSLMEEYVWRWFVYSKFKVLTGVWPAIILTACFFAVHHIVILWNFGPIDLVVVGAIGLALGSIIWGWLYSKYNSIWPGWICHVAADTAVMWICWWILTA